MKKTSNTKKLVLDRQKIRELTEIPATGGMYVDTLHCGPPPTNTCNGHCNNPSFWNCVGP